MEEEQKKALQLRYRYQVPSKLQVEDKIVSLGPFNLTLRQTLVLITGGCIALDIWRVLADTPMVLRVAFTALPVVIAFLWGMVKVSGRYTEAWLFILCQYANLPKIYYWRHDPPFETAQETQPKRWRKRSAETPDLDEESE